MGVLFILSQLKLINASAEVDIRFRRSMPASTAPCSRWQLDVAFGERRFASRVELFWLVLTCRSVLRLFPCVSLQPKHRTSVAVQA